MSSSDISSLSSAESIETDEELLSGSLRKGPLDQYFKNAKASPPAAKKKRPASPPHEYVFEDSPDIAFVVMFRARFSSAFPKSLPHFGPQDIERGISGPDPDEGVERLLCSLIGLVLNRKKDVERGHHSRALEEAVSTHAHQWPRAWEEKNPLRGGGSFNSMTPEQRLTLLKSLILWALNSSDMIQGILKDSYKQQRHEDDLNQPLSVQPWGQDTFKRRYWLVEGQDDTHFRLYRESNPALKNNTWWSVADSIQGLKTLAESLREEGSQASKRLSDRISQAIPRFEAGEEKRKRRDYRLARKAQFTRPEPGFSLYEGRTRGKRIKYTFSDDEEGSDVSTRRSARHSGISTPGEPSGPTFTASGRQVRARHHGVYGEILHSGQQDLPSQDLEQDGSHEGNDDTLNEDPTSRTRSKRPVPPRQSNGRQGRAHIEGYNALDEMDDESDATSSGNEWDGGDDEDDVDDNMADDDDIEMADESEFEEKQGDLSKQSLVVSLRYQRQSEKPSPPNGTTVVAGGETASRDEDRPLNENAPPPFQPLPKPADLELKTHSTNVLQGSITAHVTG